ncbi:hypothetical protein AR454_08165 [Bacillus mycoides]|uniref:hypothetical protein n=1 Tax=Bacillus mycoides TaxID=1405 RepID=UPI001E51974A|nr:hypothetical protein [Bacillus mycoides]MCD4646983.1 hypothetical protein [Bacillus mycoides]
MEKKLNQFFENVYQFSQENYPNQINKNLKSIIITHVMPTTVNYLLFINKIWPIEAVVGIPYSLDLKTVEELKKHGIRVETPEIIESVPKTAIKIIESLYEKNTSVIIQEVGGYLAPYLNYLKTLNNVIGIVEDTAQGHWRYEKHDKGQLPILSIAFSTLKNVEDTVVGDAVIYSLERILRENFWDVVQGKKSLVLGYGKIGKSCAIALKGRESIVSVYDINPILNITARVEGYNTGTLRKLIQDADIIVGASGSTSLQGDIFDEIKDGAILASGSSRDIEFDVSSIVNHFRREEDSLLWKCENKKGNQFYVLNQGKPVNFRDYGILGPYLYLVFGELLYCMLKISTSAVNNGIGVNSEEERKIIAKHFYETLFEEPVSLNHKEDSSNAVAGGIK